MGVWKVLQEQRNLHKNNNKWLIETNNLYFIPYCRTPNQISIQMKSPFADCEAIKKIEYRTTKFRGEEYGYYYHYYQCEKTGAIFTTDEIDAVSVNQVYNQYRAAHNIPYTEEIHMIRKAYGISASKMSQILGWGDNQYRLYENGDMPSLNNGKQLRAIQTPSIFCTFVDLSQLSETEKETIKKRAMNSLFAVDEKTKLVHSLIFGKEEGKYEGYTYQSLGKLKNVMLFFIGKIGNVFQTMMNKLLFYADFLSYKEYGHGLTGLSYYANNFGPVPKHWDKVFSLTEDITKDVISCDNGNEGYILLSNMPYDENEFTEQELKVLNAIAAKFSSCTPSRISAISHQEDAWKDNIGEHKMIDYSYAFRLKAV